jgi:hypothetical protein
LEVTGSKILRKKINKFCFSVEEFEVVTRGNWKISVEQGLRGNET